MEKNEIYSILIISFVKLNLWIIKFISIRALYFKLKSKYALNLFVCLSLLLYVTFSQILLVERMVLHGMTMGMLLTCTLCFTIIIGETHMTVNIFLHKQWCCSGVIQLELTICILRKCVSLVMAKHTWHTWFFEIYV